MADFSVLDSAEAVRMASNYNNWRCWSYSRQLRTLSLVARGRTTEDAGEAQTRAYLVIRRPYELRLPQYFPEATFTSSPCEISAAKRDGIKVVVDYGGRQGSVTCESVSLYVRNDAPAIPRIRRRQATVRALPLSEADAFLSALAGSTMRWQSLHPTLDSAAFLAVNPRGERMECRLTGLELIAWSEEMRNVGIRLGGQVEREQAAVRVSTERSSLVADPRWQEQLVLECDKGAYLISCRLIAVQPIGPWDRRLLPANDGSLWIGGPSQLEL